MSEVVPRSNTQQYHRFSGDFWEKARYDQQALPTNRAGQLTEEQRRQLTEPSIDLIMGFVLPLQGQDRDALQGGLASCCADFTKWAESVGDSGPEYELTKGAFTAWLSRHAYRALPDRGHYRIYFTHKLRGVVNVEEHSDDAPHLRCFAFEGSYRPISNNNDLEATYYVYAVDSAEAKRYVKRSVTNHDGWVSLPDTQPLRINANKYRVSGVFYPEPQYSLALRESERDPIEVDFGVPATTLEDARLYVQDYLTDGRAKIGMNREM